MDVKQLNQHQTAALVLQLFRQWGSNSYSTQASVPFLPAIVCTERRTYGQKTSSSSIHVHRLANTQTVKSLTRETTCIDWRTHRQCTCVLVISHVQTGQHTMYPCTCHTKCTRVLAISRVLTDTTHTMYPCTYHTTCTD